jgi:hypothetical protein
MKNLKTALILISLAGLCGAKILTMQGQQAHNAALDRLPAGVTLPTPKEAPRR